jgi:hypothetical protein
LLKGGNKKMTSPELVVGNRIPGGQIVAIVAAGRFADWLEARNGFQPGEEVISGQVLSGYFSQADAGAMYIYTREEGIEDGQKQ